MQLFKDANRMLAQWDGDFHTHVRFGLYPACSDGDDLLLTDPEQEGRTLRLALLRQQHTTKPDEPYLCLSDFVRPLSQDIPDTVGVFAATVDADMEHLYETGAYADDFKHLLAQTLADRLAEASTEKCTKKCVQPTGDMQKTNSCPSKTYWWRSLPASGRP